MIFLPLDLVFFQQIFPKKVRVQSWQHIHIQQQIRQKKLESKNTPKKVRVQKPPKKSESSPTTHVTETRFLHVLDPPDHFGTIYIFDDFFTFGLSFFPTNFPKKSWSPELAAYSHSAADSPKKVRVQRHPKKVKSPAPQPTSQKPVFSTF